MSGSHVFVLAIIALTFGFALLKSWIKNRPEEPPGATGEGEEMLARIDHLEQRIRVLERIVTDGNHDLKREIDEL